MSHPVRVRGLKQNSTATRVHWSGSHPVRVRGLKHLGSALNTSIAYVAPRAGAWIETLSPSSGRETKSSHPVRVRGLKQQRLQNEYLDAMVAPRAGAWIETGHLSYAQASDAVAPRAGAWIETSLGQRERIGQTSRTPCGCVD